MKLKFLSLCFCLLLFSCGNITEKTPLSNTITVKNTEKPLTLQKNTTKTIKNTPNNSTPPPNTSEKASQTSPPKPKKKIKKPILQDSIAPYVEEESPLYIPDAIPESEYPNIFGQQPQFASDGFDFPVGKPDAVGYYKSQRFGDRRHLGEDWNGKGGGNTDLGDPVYASANGLVTFVDDICCGWGNTVRIIHYIPENEKTPYIESLYSHLHTMHVEVGSMVHRGQQIGTIGTADGRYIAHLHFEMRDFINMSIGPGYSDDKMGYLDPTPFIEQHRPVSKF